MIPGGVIMDTVLFLLTLISFAATVVFLISTVIAKIKKNGKSKGQAKKAAIAFAATIVCLIGFAIVVPKIDPSEGPKTEEKTPTASTEPTEVPALSTEALAETPPSEEGPIHVFYIDLENDISQYDGEVIITSFPVKHISSGGRIVADDTLLTDNMDAMTGDDTLYSKRDTIQYVTLQGRAERQSEDVTIFSADVIYAGGAMPDDLQQDMENYEHAICVARIAEREDFISRAVTPSYEELRRYPDTYAGQPLAITVYVSMVEPDGILSNGNVWATYDGGEVGVYDLRMFREPRLLDGDTITIYAEGLGLTTVTSFIEGSGFLGTNLGAKVTDTREIPAFAMKYTSLDNTDAFGSVKNAEEGDYYLQIGRELIASGRYN